MRILITGGAGFIGSALIRTIVRNTSYDVLNVDKLTYAGDLSTVAEVSTSPKYKHIKVDICDRNLIDQAFASFNPDAIVHLAAESHVDRSVDSPGTFVKTNVDGTYVMLEAARSYWSSLSPERRASFRFLHVSTDEVFGSLGEEGQFMETTAYAPSSPYSASKAAADHLVRAWLKTYGLPTIVTNCSNNYGPYQFPEKLIPLMILKSINEESLPVYGSGENVRDWLHVEDHVAGLLAALRHGRPGESYNFGGDAERRNIDVVNTLCDLLDNRVPRKDKKSYRQLITHVTDRPGHDLRYAVCSDKAQKELGWQQQFGFKDGLAQTLDWYLENLDWCQRIHNDRYSGQRLGMGTLKRVAS